MEINVVEDTDFDNQTKPIAEESPTELVVKEQTETAAKEDPFAYLDRNDFTSEKYKVEVRNLPKYYGNAVSKKLLIMFTTEISSKKYSRYLFKTYKKIKIVSGVQEINQCKVEIKLFQGENT